MLARAGGAKLFWAAAARGAGSTPLTIAPRRVGVALASGEGVRCSAPTSRCQARAWSASSASIEDGTGRKEGEGSSVTTQLHIPERTVPDELLNITIRTYYGADTAERYPNVHGVHPAEFKVELRVSVPLLELTEKQEERLLLLVGPRYHAKRKVLKLVCDTYPNRVDNKRYLIYLLETLLIEARRTEEE